MPDIEWQLRYGSEEQPEVAEYLGYKENEMTNAAEIKDRIIHALTQYDQKQMGKRGYNPYALGHYIHAADAIEEAIVAGVTPRQAILDCLSDRVAAAALKSIGERM